MTGQRDLSRFYDGEIAVSKNLTGQQCSIFSNLGWLPIGTGTNTTVRVLDLTGQLNLLTNSQLNVAAQGDLGIDWAMLELQVAPNPIVTTNSLTPVADATVRGGTNANSNFGTATNLTVQQSSSTNNQQQAICAGI